MTPDERARGEQLGILIGKVEGLGREIGDLKKQDAETRRENADDHATVISRLDRLDAKIDAKASEAWVQQHEDRIDKIEKAQDVRSGADAARGSLLERFIWPTLVGVVLTMLTLIATKGI